MAKYSNHTTEPTGEGARRRAERRRTSSRGAPQFGATAEPRRGTGSRRRPGPVLPSCLGGNKTIRRFCTSQFISVSCKVVISGWHTCVNLALVRSLVKSEARQLPASSQSPAFLQKHIFPWIRKPAKFYGVQGGVGPGEEKSWQRWRESSLLSSVCPSNARVGMMVSNTCRIETIKNTVRRKNNDKDLELKKKPPTRELMLAIVLPAKKSNIFRIFRNTSSGVWCRGNLFWKFFLSNLRKLGASEENREKKSDSLWSVRHRRTTRCRRTETAWGWAGRAPNGGTTNVNPYSKIMVH